MLKQIKCYKYGDFNIKSPESQIKNSFPHTVYKIMIIIPPFNRDNPIQNILTNKNGNKSQEPHLFGPRKPIPLMVCKILPGCIYF